ncbi:oxygen-independent coproporphyrinogen III oxidase [Haliangium ochraceum DSM 14365]|uniref:Heme chaperone HemW n=1 Tax=Haliangium ochraceum (strain DSM 14365 / JCM 11303 / SMP-2) TaxID=502025 RepID=D0LKN4_HALO1|nr:oxygen-independent coproporphyrinogen III oxidase [Haliangium ochraceum DSM 14365]
MGVYVHVPWCRTLCPYCDFAVSVVGRSGIPHRAYLDALCAELSERAPALGDRELVSIYLGGGTPSLWEPACVAALIDAVTAALGARSALARGALEITLEANPQDCAPERLAAWRQGGVNRLSIGVQSLRPQALAVLGRSHLGDGMAALAAARAAGFTRVSADAIFGVPGAAADRDDSALDRSIEALAATGVGHLSVYELTIETRTAYGKAVRAGRMQPLAEDVLAAQYEAVHRALAARGYQHYEISSYARPGHRAVHNSLYWSGAEYLGLGCGAASFLLREGGGGERATNLRSVHAYLRARGDQRVAAREQLSPQDVALDRVWLGMRTIDGIPAAALARAPELVDWLLSERLVTREGERLCPTLRGFSYADRIASRMFDAGAKIG